MTQDTQPPEPSEKEKELMESARETKEEIEAAQADALEQIAEGEDFEDYETVQIGEVEMRVRAYLPGEVEDTVLQAQQLGESGDPADIKRSVETMLSALAQMTTSDTYNMDFWREFYQKWGAQGITVAVETVLKPASENMDQHSEAVESFRGN